MAEKITVKSIIRQYLKTYGFDGLFSPHECGCEREDLFPCDSCPGDCLPGYRIADPSGEYPYLIGLRPPANNREEEMDD